MNLFKTSLSLRLKLLFKRKFQTSYTYNYDTEGKTTVTILNKNFDYGIMIDNVGEQGFILNNGIRTIGPMIIFPKTMLSWNISSSLDMDEESFSLFTNLEPKLDILVIGLDDDYPYNAPFILAIKNYLKTFNIKTEVQPTIRACSTFNFLNSENRYAAAALIPPRLKDKKLLSNNELSSLPLDQKVNKRFLLLDPDKSTFIISEKKFNC